MPKKILEVKNLSKYFISKYGVNKAVDDVSFDLFEGEIIGLVGQSGSGKTTIGNAIMRTLTEVNGIITLDGKVVSGKIKKDVRKDFTQNVQMIFQDPHTSLNEKRNVFSTIAEPLKTNKIINKETKEFLSNHNEVKKVFNLTFKTDQLKDELKHLTLKESLFDRALGEIKDNFKVYKEMQFRDPENEFSEIIYAFFQPIAEAYRETFNSLVSSNDHLYEIYSKASKDIKIKNLPKDEVALTETTEKILAIEKDIKAFKNQAKYIAKVNAAAKLKKREAVLATKNLFDGFIKDFKTKIKFHKSIADVETNKELFLAEKQKNVVSREAIKNLSQLKNKGLILSADEVLDISKEITSSNLTELEDRLRTKTNIIIEAMDVENNKKLVRDQKLFDNYDLGKNKQKLEQLKVKLLKDQKLFDSELEKFKVQWELDFNKLKDDVNAKSALVSNKQIEANFSGITLEFRELISSFINRQKERLVLKTTSINENKANRLKEIAKTFDKNKKSKLMLSNKALIRREKIKLKDQKEFIKDIQTRVKENKTKLNDFLAEEKILIKDVEASKVFLGMKRPKTTLYRETKKILLNRRVFKALADVGLKAEHAYRYPHEFSGGQKQRIVIARALIMNPKVIVADEPIASLDVSIQAQVINILIRLARRDNISMIFIGHDLSAIEYLADSMLVMHLGKIVEKGLTGPIFGNPVHPYTQQLFDAIPKLSSANIPFRDSSLKVDYRREYAKNEPSFVRVAPKHFVLMNEMQTEKWSNTKKVKKQTKEMEKTRVLELKKKVRKSSIKKTATKKAAVKKSSKKKK